MWHAWPGTLARLLRPGNRELDTCESMAKLLIEVPSGRPLIENVGTGQIELQDFKCLVHRYIAAHPHLSNYLQKVQITAAAAAVVRGLLRQDPKEAAMKLRITLALWSVWQRVPRGVKRKGEIIFVRLSHQPCTSTSFD